MRLFNKWIKRGRVRKSRNDSRDRNKKVERNLSRCS
jgi:hypothetical protein